MLSIQLIASRDYRLTAPKGPLASQNSLALEIELETDNLAPKQHHHLSSNPKVDSISVGDNHSLVEVVSMLHSPFRRIACDEMKLQKRNILYYNQNTTLGKLGVLAHLAYRIQR